jgi:hypothetical protein
MHTTKLLFIALSSTLRGLADDGDRVRGEVIAAHHAAEEPHKDAATQLAVTTLLDMTASIAPAYEALADAIDALGGSVDLLGQGQPVTSAWLRYEATFAHLMSKKWLMEMSSLWRDMASAIE